MIFSFSCVTAPAALRPLKRERRPGLLPTADGEKSYSILKNFFCSSQFAGSPALNVFSVTWSGRAPMIARWTISGESSASWSVCDTTARSLPRCCARSETPLNIDVLRVVRWIGLEPSVTVPGRDKKVTIYGFHSLRHSFASYCAEAGVPQATVVSILGADSEIVTKYYTHVGNEAQQQAIAAVSGAFNTSSAQSYMDQDYFHLIASVAFSQASLII